MSYVQLDMIPGVNIIDKKVRIASVNGAGGGILGVLWESSRGFRGLSTLREFLGSKENPHWLKIDLNAAEIITVQNYKYTKKN